MSNYEEISLLVAFCALVITLLVSALNLIVAIRVASADFSAKQSVKTETAKLSSCLRSIIQKVSVSQERKKNIGFSIEQETISRFLASEAALAFHRWVEEKDQAARFAGRSEGWRVFFRTLTQIVRLSNKEILAAEDWAADALLTLGNLKKSDIRQISRFNSDLAGNIARMLENKGGDPLVRIMLEKRREFNEENSSERFTLKLSYVRDHFGHTDPDLDFFLAMLQNDTDGATAAMRNGADWRITDKRLLKRYESELADFPPLRN